MKKTLICKSVYRKPYSASESLFQKMETASVKIEQEMRTSTAGNSYIQRVVIVADTTIVCTTATVISSHRVIHLNLLHNQDLYCVQVSR